MIVGITGTQDGCTDEQFVTLGIVLKFYRDNGYNRLDHGDCIGVDAEAHLLARQLEYEIIGIHPPIMSGRRAFKKSDLMFEPKEYLKRNYDIANVCNTLVAVPKQSDEVRRGSGTWATIRYARTFEKPIIIILPDGFTRRER
jgi:hypothetical protein